MPKAKNQPATHDEPVADRPFIPGYGVPKAKKGMLSWSHVSERMESAQNYWIGTTDAEGCPHATPVWGIWLDNRLYFGGSPRTRRGRNLAGNPAVVVHLESGSDVVILRGKARQLQKPDPALTTRLAAVSATKYGYKPSPEEYEGGGLCEVVPEVVLAWKEFPKDATRWRFVTKELKRLKARRGKS